MSSLPVFSRIPLVLRRERVVEEIRQAILSGQITPGVQLIESRLSTQFGVSRGLLREAIRELIESGLIYNKPYAGAFVAGIDVHLLQEVYEIRGVLEAQAYTRIWPLRDSLFRKELQQHFDSMMKAVKKGDLREKARTEAQFHGLVYERCGNQLLLKFWKQMTQKLQLALGICQVADVSKMDFQDNHERFLELAVGDDLGAMLVELDAHLKRGFATIQAALAGEMGSGSMVSTPLGMTPSLAPTTAATASLRRPPAPKPPARQAGRRVPRG